LIRRCESVKKIKLDAREGRKSLIRKMRILLFAPIVLLIHLASPFLLVRIGAIFGQRVGHLGLDLELSLCYERSRKRASRFPKTIDLFYLTSAVSNTYLLQLWREQIVILPKWLLDPIHVLNNRLPSYSKYNYFEWVQRSGHQDLSLLDRYPPTLTMPQNDLEKGKRLLKELGVAPNQPYICLAVRDKAYLAGQEPKLDWSYHDFRDSEIADYLEMAEYLAELGFIVLRMGKIVKDALISRNPNVIDYANSKLQSDFADVFLFSTCTFCISTSTGMDALASIFRVPIGLVNIVSTNSVGIGGLVKLYQPKLFMDQKTGKALTYQEIRARNLFEIGKSSDFEKKGISLVENSPKDLCLFAEELIEILSLESSVSNNRTASESITADQATEKEKIDKLSKNWLQNHQYYLD
jgi:putative glycosyltransferase (TIGR04372 family)